MNTDRSCGPAFAGQLGDIWLGTENQNMPAFVVIQDNNVDGHQWAPHVGRGIHAVGV